MSKIKVYFIFKDKKLEFEFIKDDLIQNIFSSFANKINRNMNNFNYVYNSETIINYENKKLSDLNNKDNLINIFVYEKSGPNENKETYDKNTIEKTSLEISEHIICPKCKKMCEIGIDNFKISIKNCENNHSMSSLYMNDFINTQYIDSTKIKCYNCKKSEKDLLYSNKFLKYHLLQCSCGIILCDSCFHSHKETKEKTQENNEEPHYSIEYQDKDFFCFKHNSMFIGFCHKCKKNICSKCESDHNKHRIDIFKKISPNEVFIKKIKSMKEELISKLNNFNNELDELINLLNKISNNIKNDLKIFSQIAQKVIDNFSFTKKNYQTINNIKVIYNNIGNNQILKDIDRFLIDSSPYSRIKIIMNIYDKFYLEKDNISLENEEKFKTYNKHKINNIENNKNENKKNEIEKENTENAFIDKKSNNKNYMILKYTPNLNNIKDNKIKIVGKQFAEKNKLNFSMTIKEEEYPISEYYSLNKKDFNKNNELIIKINQIKPITDISFMFHSDINEPSIYLSEIISINNFNIDQVKDISNLFSNCTHLKTIPCISNWDTSLVENMSNLFYRCSNLISIPDISNWKVYNATNMSYMFYDCKNIISLPDLSKWHTNNLSDMRGIFCNCSSLKVLPDISKWNTEKVNNMSGLFQHCNNLTNFPDISKWMVGNVVNMSGMFDHCISLQSLPDISNWDMKNVINLNYMFYYCSSLNSLPDISLWNTINAKNMKGLFCDCGSLSVLPDISKWKTSNVTNMSFMFYNCKSLLSLPDLVQWDISKIEDMKNMFTNCQKLPKKVIPKKFKI